MKQKSREGRGRGCLGRLLPCSPRPRHLLALPRSRALARPREVSNASPRRSDSRLRQAPRACRPPCPRPSAPRRHLAFPARSPPGPEGRARLPGRGESEGGCGGRRGACQAGKDAEGLAGLSSLQPPLGSGVTGCWTRDPARRRRARRGAGTIPGAPPPEQPQPPAPSPRPPRRLAARADPGSGELGPSPRTETWAGPGVRGVSWGQTCRAFGRQ